MLCPDCGGGLAKQAKSCGCGWTAQRAAAKADRQYRGPCKVESCGSQFDGSDGLCGFHRAMRKGDLPAWRESQQDRLEVLYSEFRRNHEGDIWSSLIDVSLNLQSDQEKHELLVQLKQLMPDFGGLPYDPRQRESA